MGGVGCPGSLALVLCGPAAAAGSAEVCGLPGVTGPAAAVSCPAASRAEASCVPPVWGGSASTGASAPVVPVGAASADGTDPDGGGATGPVAPVAVEASEGVEEAGAVEGSEAVGETGAVEGSATSCARSGVLAVREDSSACFLASPEADRARAGGVRTSWWGGTWSASSSPGVSWGPAGLGTSSGRRELSVLTGTSLLLAHGNGPSTCARAGVPVLGGPSVCGIPYPRALCRLPAWLLSSRGLLRPAPPGVPTGASPVAGPQTTGASR